MSIFCLLNACAVKETKRVVDNKPTVVKETVPTRFKNPSPGYFCGISVFHLEEQDAINDALLHAREQIAEYLNVNIDKASLKEYLTKGNTSGILTTDVFGISITKVVANAILRETKLTEYWTVEEARRGTYGVNYCYKTYALVYFSYTEHRNFMKSLFQGVLNIAKNEYKKAQDSENNGNIKSALLRYYELLNITQKIDNILPPDEIISLKGKVNEIASDARIAIKSIKSGIILTSLTEKIEVNTREGTLEFPLKVFASYNGKPVRKLPISFSFSEGEGITDETIVTNEEGIATCYVKNYRISIREHKAVITSKAYIPELGIDFPKVKFVLNYISNTVAVEVRGVPQLARSVKETIEEVSRNQGLEVIPRDMADLICEAKLREVESKFKNYFGETFAYAKISLNIKIYDKEKTILFSKTLTEEAWDDNSLEEAKEKTVEKIIKTLPLVIDYNIKK